MQHCDPDVLGLVALGERPSPQDAGHLSTCPDCQADVAELRGVVDAVRVDVPVGPAVVPSARVWDGIAARTGVGVAPRPDRMRGGADVLDHDHDHDQVPVREDAPDGPATREVPDRDAGGSADPDVADPDVVRRLRPRSSRANGPADEEGRRYTAGPAGPGPLRRGRRSQRHVPWRLLAVAASFLLVGAAGGAVVTAALTQERADVTVVQQTPLQGLPLAPDASGRAEVVQTASGRQLDVDVSRLGPAAEGYYEVWLIDRNVRQMVPVGILQGSTGRFTLPEGLDVSAFPVVDISVETPGDPRHSGRSVLRGTIES